MHGTAGLIVIFSQRSIFHTDQYTMISFGGLRFLSSLFAIAVISIHHNATGGIRTHDSSNSKLFLAVSIVIPER